MIWVNVVDAHREEAASATSPWMSGHYSDGEAPTFWVDIS
jgi:hypothetical protein